MELVKFGDYFGLAVKNLKRRQLRSWLTLIGIFISIATIFTLISLSLGLQAAVQDQFTALGTDKLFIQAKGGFGAPGEQTPSILTEDDVKVIEKVPGVKKVTYFTIANAAIKYNDETRYYAVYGMPQDGFDLYFQSTIVGLDDGRIPHKNSKEALMGWDFKYSNVFKRPIKQGTKFLINGQEFKASGVVGKIGNPQDDKNIMLEINDFKALFNTGKRADYIFIQIDGGEDAQQVSDRIERRLMSFRGVTEKTKDFSILTPQQLLASFQTILLILTGFLGAVAGISLFVGGIGIANTMYTAVLERTREIGVMKAVGAKNNDILLIFLIEAGLIGAVGGVVGTIMGIGVSNLVAYVATVQFGTNLVRAATPWWLIVSCIDFAFLVGALSGILPAKRAETIKTVDALRYE